jgi:hypothetical protein
MKTATIRKALLPVLAASAVMVSTPALAQSFGVTLSFGSPGYSQGHGYSSRDLHYRAQALSQQIDRMAWNGTLRRNEARNLSHQLQQVRSLEYRYARNGLTAREYALLDQRLDRIQYRLQRVQRTRW